MTASLPRQDSRSRVRTTLLLAGAGVIAIAVNAAIAAAAITLGAPSGYGPLTVPANALLTIVGLAIGWVGWLFVQSRSRNPRRTLMVLVPLVTLLSFVPDILLLAVRFVPGTNAPAVIALMLMHLVVVACAVPAYWLASRERAHRN